MQALFYMDMSNAFSEKNLQDYCHCFPPGKRVFPFFEHLVNGVLQNREDIDRVVERFSSNWKMRRMACVDRNVLRFAVFELLYCADIPAKVSINEAIDIGKKYGTPETGAFINGILDSIRLAIENGQLQTIDAGPSPQPLEVEEKIDTV